MLQVRSSAGSRFSYATWPIDDGGAYHKVMQHRRGVTIRLEGTGFVYSFSPIRFLTGFVVLTAFFGAAIGRHTHAQCTDPLAFSAQRTQVHSVHRSRRIRCTAHP